MGTEIHSFREFVRGDSLRQVYWKKSASLGRWIMTYAAFGPLGPRVGLQLGQVGGAAVAVGTDEAGDDERSIGSESRRDHRSPGEPPGHIPAGEEVLVEAFSTALGEVDTDAYREDEIGGDDCPVDRSEHHVSWDWRWSGKTFAMFTPRAFRTAARYHAVQPTTT